MPYLAYAVFRKAGAPAAPTGVITATVAYFLRADGSAGAGYVGVGVATSLTGLYLHALSAFDPAIHDAVVRFSSTDATLDEMTLDYLVTDQNGTVPSAAAVADAVWNEGLLGHATPNTFGWVLQVETTFTGLLAGATATTATLDADEPIESLYAGWGISIYSGVGVGQYRTIAGYVSATRVATVDRAWTITPNTSSVYRLWPPVTLDAGGLDALPIEAGVHARQALQRIAAATAGVETRPDDTTVTYAAVGNPGTTRISATINATTNVREAVAFP